MNAKREKKKVQKKEFEIVCGVSAQANTTRTEIFNLKWFWMSLMLAFIVFVFWPVHTTLCVSTMRKYFVIDTKLSSWRRRLSHSLGQYKIQQEEGRTAWNNKNPTRYSNHFDCLRLRNRFSYRLNSTCWRFARFWLIRLDLILLLQHSFCLFYWITHGWSSRESLDVYDAIRLSFDNSTHSTHN